MNEIRVRVKLDWEEIKPGLSGLGRGLGRNRLPSIS